MSKTYAQPVSESLFHGRTIITCIGFDLIDRMLRAVEQGNRSTCFVVNPTYFLTKISIFAWVERMTKLRPSYAINEKAKSSKKSISKGRVESYMSTVNGGGDPVTAVALRPVSPIRSTTDRQARVEREVSNASAQL
ncbi:hypothetical protein PG985_009513 [Apiospora marii]|uniref:uncharacterized protein n=1 Tax=Apiospora marii TaxID=335849 RepID=UPI00312F6031